MIFMAEPQIFMWTGIDFIPLILRPFGGGGGWQVKERFHWRDTTKRPLIYCKFFAFRRVDWWRRREFRLGKQHDTDNL